MNISASAHLPATDAVSFRDLPAHDVTILATGKWSAGDVVDGPDMHIGGTVPQRIDFLLRLAHAAQRAADDLAGARAKTTATDAVLREVGASYYMEGDR